jgi:hypothetical protein
MNDTTWCAFDSDETLVAKVTLEEEKAGVEVVRNNTRSIRAVLGGAGRGQPVQK